MKKHILSLIIIGLLIFPVLALAQVDIVEVPTFSAFGLLSRLQVLANWLFTILLIIAVIFLIVAAFTFITAQGDPEKVIKARKFVIYALIGVGVGVASYGLVSLVIWIFDPNTNPPW